MNTEEFVTSATRRHDWPHEMGMVKIDARLLEALDKFVTARDYDGRDALVNAVLRAWLNRADNAAQKAIYTRPILKQELVGDETEGEPGVVYELLLREVSVATQPRKIVSVRRHLKTADGAYHDTHGITFPVVATAWVRELLLPWLASGLSQVENIHRNEVTESRRRGQARLNDRTDDEKLLESQTRRLYSEQYGKERWTYAVKQANRHRSRAERHGLTEHFTTAQWLNRAALTDFCCPMCNADSPLETHHTHALASGGSNVIDNVQLLCATCHIKVGERGEDGGDEWYVAELQKVDLFQVGNTVRREFAYGARASDRGTVLEVLLPARGEGPLWCLRMPLSVRNGMAGKLILRTPIWDDPLHSGYARTLVRVLWTRKTGKTYEEAVKPSEIVICSPAKTVRQVTE